MKISNYVVASLSAIFWMIFPGISPVAATTITAAEDASKFGSLDQGTTNCPQFGCGPTAAVNSFVYLQAMFPRTYMTPLVPANQAAAVANRSSPPLAGNW